MEENDPPTNTVFPLTTMAETVELGAGAQSERE
jgi:hypothetical protein